jgi:hypothetical protein
VYRSRVPSVTRRLLTDIRALGRPRQQTQTPRRELGGTHAVGVYLIIGRDCTARYLLIANGESNGEFSQSRPFSDLVMFAAGVGAVAGCRYRHSAGVSLPG